ncbi:zinc finger protein 567-like [Condylostylus longicornis]|uniref:zinc finger protein 567-like n=1 Tax=Condylostylus longicornis TaxID=2530218 RepID=UPI00244E01ED|nr:zinc finger protein 567-like [Condylostylus longicornis]
MVSSGNSHGSDSSQLFLDEDEFTLHAASYGEFFFIENNPEKWWICCNICKDKYSVVDTFINHAINQHIQNGINGIHKIEIESLNLENTIDTMIEDINTSCPSSINSSEDENYYEDVEFLGEDIFGKDDMAINSSNEIRFIKNENINSINVEDKEVIFPKTIKSEQIYEENENYEKKILTNGKETESEDKEADKDESEIIKTEYSEINPKKTETNTKKGKRFPCSECDKTYATKAKQKIHIATHFELPPLFKCEECGGVYSSKDVLKAHMRTHTGERPLKCRLCPKDYRTHHGLISHMMTHTGTRKFSCRFCEKRFYTKINVIHHERIHTGEKPYMCDICGEKFRTTGLLTIHKKRHKPLDPGENNNDMSTIVKIERKPPGRLPYIESKSHPEKKFHCKFCVARFSCKYALDEHQKTIHAKSRGFICKICKEHFQTRSAVWYHIEKGHLCNPIANLNYVMETYQVNEPTCRNISKTSSTEEIHTEEKKFMCNICSTTFATKKGLRMHEYIHTETKDYICNLCKKSFRTYADINYHLRRKHKCATTASCNYTLARQKNTK